MLGKLPVLGRPTNLYDSRARAYCACSRCRWGCLDIFTLIYPFSPLSPSLWETSRYRLKYCLKGPLSPKQPTNQSKAPGQGHNLMSEVKICLGTVLCLKTGTPKELGHPKNWDKLENRENNYFSLSKELDHTKKT